MPAVTALKPSPRPRLRVKLALLTVGVLLAHAALLHSALLAGALPLASSSALERPFTTRTIAAPIAPAATQAPAPAPATQPRPSPKAPAAAPTNAVSAGLFAPDAPSAPEHHSPAVEALPQKPPPEAESVQVAAVSPSTAPTHTEASAPPAAPQRRYAIPPPVRLKYTIRGEVKGFSYTVYGDLLWQHDDTSYSARLEISHFLLGSRVQTSKGELTPQGLEPLRFGDKVRSEVAAHFERAKGKVSFSANTPDAALQSGAQDQLSVFMQLASMVAGAPAQFAPGTSVTFQAVGPRSSEQWAFVAGTLETLELPGGVIQALKFTREPGADFDSRAEIWLAPQLGYLPVRIRLVQANGDFADQLWKATETP